MSNSIFDAEAAVECIATKLWESVRGERGDWEWCKRNDPRHALHILSVARGAVINAQYPPRATGIDLSFKNALLGLK